MFLKQVRQSPMMKYDMEYYHRLPASHEDKTYEWLLQRVQDRMLDHRQKQVGHQLGYGGAPALAGSVVVCKFHAAGNCNRGDSCSMFHEIPAGYVIPTPKGGKGDKGGKGKEDK